MSHPRACSRHQQRIVLLALGFLAGCAGLFQLGPRPAQLAGVWVDSAATTDGDTMSLVLDEGGDDRSIHVRVRRDVQGTVMLDTDRKLNGRWWVSGALADTVHRQLCVTRRPGRNPGTCVPFRVDTVPAENRAGLRRRLILWRIEDRQRQSGRVLLERTP
jgi:hypothetical protein